MALKDFMYCAGKNYNLNEMLYSCSVTYLKLGNIAKAKEYVEKAIGNDKSIPKNYHMKGIILAITKDHNASIKEFTKAIELDASYFDAWFHRGMAYSSIQNYAMANLDFSECINLNPQNNEAYFNRGVSLYHLGNKNKACEDLVKARDLGNPQAVDYLSMYCDIR
ncbi:MAG: hypothetical protein HC906_19240 [Bacteroidales bacterium]|nr:hypothetical protein [Bacteroidales bacterium]